MSGLKLPCHAAVIGGQYHPVDAKCPSISEVFEMDTGKPFITPGKNGLPSLPTVTSQKDRPVKSRTASLVVDEVGAPKVFGCPAFLWPRNYSGLSL